MAAKTRRPYSEADKERFTEQRREQLEAMQQQIVEASTRTPVSKITAMTSMRVNAFFIAVP